MEQKNISFEIKAEPAEGNSQFSWSGYVAAFGNVDSYGDRIEKGAFAEDVGKTIPAFFEHNQPVGKMKLISENSVGLFVKGILLPDEMQPDSVGALSDRMRFYMSKDSEFDAVKYKMSIGYYAVDYSYEDNVRVLTKLKLIEGSLVMNPANDKAVITSWKSNGLTLESALKMEEQELEKKLTIEHGITPDLARFFVEKTMQQNKNSAKFSDDFLEVIKTLKKFAS